MVPINEDKFLETLFLRLPSDDALVVPPGDDCAALAINGNQLLLISVDQLSEDVHYFSHANENPTCPKLAGRKLLARGISDIAAMGGVPKYALTAISTGPDYGKAWLNDFTEGVLRLAKEFGVTLIGGDLAAAGSNVASATVMGWVPPKNICLRSQTRAGDRVVVTGEFGASLLTEKHLRFNPRVQEGSWLAQNDYTRSMIDVSDGLLKDLSRLCQSSNLSAILNEDSVPCTIVDNCKIPLANALLDGEDYELLFSVTQSKCDQLLNEWPFSVGLSIIGHFTEPRLKQLVINENGVNLLSKFGPGFNHYS